VGIFTTWILRIFGLCGILRAIIFVCGDLLYHHVPGSPDSPAVKMSRLSDKRLLNAGTLGLIGYWFYVLGAMHLYLTFRPAGEIFAFIILLAFGAVMISYGISHAAFFSIATGAKAAAELGSDAETGGNTGMYFSKGW
jgi:hypothetical protein